MTNSQSKHIWQKTLSNQTYDTKSWQFSWTKANKAPRTLIKPTTKNIGGNQPFERFPLQLNSADGGDAAESKEHLQAGHLVVRDTLGRRYSYKLQILLKGDFFAIGNSQGRKYFLVRDTVEEINNQLGRKYFEQAEFLWKTISQFYLKIGIKFVAQDDEELYQVKQKCMFH